MSLLTWPLRIVGFVVWVTTQIVRSGVAVIVDILTPADRSTPHIVRVPTRCENDLEVALLSMVVSLIPGTLTIATEHPRARPAVDGRPVRRGDGADRGRAVLYIHALNGTETDVMSETHALETRLLRAVRRKGGPR